MRYAIYFAPQPGTALHDLGSRWLGRDAVTGEALPQPAADGLFQLTAEARRYGFHATLKPPFALRDGLPPETLMRAAAALAADVSSFSVRLQLGVIDGFLALVPEGPHPALNRLAERCVCELDGLRQPPGADELARRRRAPLSGLQETYLLQWGYPCVLDEFRFHMTLSERLDLAEATRLGPLARQHFAPALAQPVLTDGLTMFQEAGAGMPFLATRHFPFSQFSAEAAK